MVGFHLSERSRIGKSIEIESRVVVAGGWVGGTGSDHLTGTEFPFGGDESVLELDQDGCTTL